MLLTVDNLCVEFRQGKTSLTALDNVSFKIAEGEVLGIVGESGAGKSLTGSAVIGLLQSTGRIASGSIRFQGRELTVLNERDYRRIRGREIAMIFQDPSTSLNPLFTIGTQLVRTIRTHLNLNAQAARKRAIELLTEVGIQAPEDRIDVYPHQLSGGMRQRVVIALALAAEPKLIIADEPTTALDVSTQAQIMALLKRIASTHGMAIMLVSHDMGVIAQMSDRVAVMYAGRVIEIGEVDEVLNHSRHPYTAGLIASIPGLRDNQPRLNQVRGSMPRLNQIPEGCAFHPRCDRAMDCCRSRKPALLPQGKVSVACHLHDTAETAEDLQ